MLCVNFSYIIFNLAPTYYSPMNPHVSCQVFIFKGRRDLTSAMRRKLNRRLFKKKKKPDQSPLPDVLVRNAWGDNSTQSRVRTICL